jgi:hypothetical protein
MLELAFRKVANRLSSLAYLFSLGSANALKSKSLTFLADRQMADAVSLIETAMRVGMCCALAAVVAVGILMVTRFAAWWDNAPRIFHAFPWVTTEADRGRHHSWRRPQRTAAQRRS